MTSKQEVKIAKCEIYQHFCCYVLLLCVVICPHISVSSYDPIVSPRCLDPVDFNVTADFETSTFSSDPELFQSTHINVNKLLKINAD